MSKPKFTNLTINWKGNYKVHRGLTETVLETLREYGVKHKKPTAITEAENLEHAYFNLWKEKVFPIEQELKLCEKYVHVLI